MCSLAEKLYYLDRHKVYCPFGTSLNYFQLEQQLNYYMTRYKFECCPLPQVSIVQTAHTCHSF